MTGKKPLIDFSVYDLDRVVAGIEAIRELNPQRHEMELLTAIVHCDPDRNECVGYKQTSPDDFWTRGHMPGLPLMPGVLMCEAAAQLSAYFTQKYDMLGCEMIGFGGMDGVRFRGIVRPGDRLVIQTKLTKVRRGALIKCQFEGYVDKNRVVEGTITGIPLPLEALRESS